MAFGAEDDDEHINHRLEDPIDDSLSPPLFLLADLHQRPIIAKPVIARSYLSSIRYESLLLYLGPVRIGSTSLSLSLPTMDVLTKRAGCWR